MFFKVGGTDRRWREESSTPEEEDPNPNPNPNLQFYLFNWGF